MAKKLDSFTNAILYIVVGALFVIFKAQVLDFIFWVMGVLLVVFGVLDLVQKRDTITAIIKIGLGVLIILCGALVMEILLIVLGVYIAIQAVLAILNKGKKNLFDWIKIIALLALGILLIVNNWAAMDIIFIIIGILFIVTGVLELLGKKTVIKKK